MQSHAESVSKRSHTWSTDELLPTATGDDGGDGETEAPPPSAVPTGGDGGGDGLDELPEAPPEVVVGGGEGLGGGGEGLGDGEGDEDAVQAEELLVSGHSNHEPEEVTKSRV